MEKTGIEAVLIANRTVKFSKDDKEVSYQELTFLIEDKTGNAKTLVLRPQNPDIKALVPTFEELIKGDFVYGNLIVEYQEIKTDRGIAYKPKYVAFNVGKAKTSK